MKDNSDAFGRPPNSPHFYPLLSSFPQGENDIMNNLITKEKELERDQAEAKIKLETQVRSGILVL
jgi:hypothetical protein